MKTGQLNKPEMLLPQALLKREISLLDLQSQFAMEPTTDTALKLKKLFTLTHGRDTTPFLKVMDLESQSQFAMALTLDTALRPMLSL